MCFFASFVTFWPYNMSLSLDNYQFDLMDGGGWDSYYNSIRMACYTAVFGTIIVFSGAYFVEKSTPGVHPQAPGRAGERGGTACEGKGEGRCVCERGGG